MGLFGLVLRAVNVVLIAKLRQQYLVVVQVQDRDIETCCFEVELEHGLKQAFQLHEKFALFYVNTIELNTEELFGDQELGR